MRYLKIGLTALLAVMALMAYVGIGTASAAELYKDTNFAFDDTQGVGVKFTATLEGGSSAVFEDADNNAIETCTGSELEFLIESAGTNGSTFSNPTGSFQKHTYTGCKNVKVLRFGTWEVRNVKGTNSGLVISTGTEVTVSTVWGSCVITTNQTYIGTLTGAGSEKANAKLDVDGALNGTGAVGCPTTARWTATYVVTTPTGLYVNP